MLLDLPYLMSWISSLSSYASWLYDAKLVDLLCLMLRCWTSRTRVKCCLMSSVSSHAIWSGLPDARLLDLLYVFSLCSWTFPTSCQGACYPLKHVMLFGLAFKMLHCLISITSWCATSPPSLPPVAGWFSISDLCFLVIWSCIVMLICLISSASCYILDLPCLIWGLVFEMLCCWIFSTSCCLVSSLYQIFAFWLFDGVLIMLSCLIFSASH